MVAKSGVSLNWGGLDTGLNKLAKGLANKGQLLKNCAGVLLSRTLKRFQDEVAPDDTPWKATKRSGKILTNTARLRDSVETATTANSVLIGSNVEYARIHQYGGIIKPKKAKSLAFKGADGSLRFAKQVTIPARPYLGMSKDDKEELIATINDFIANSLTGKK